ncbi:uncharacterized protein si:ch211-217g15.3 [Nerophis ophidion]|uniref:uncharacterized protein si:ch211-217g15.3 n=1 Tax=Nerophis ophidion TaxID=159077 RepID=UPI002ADFE174|nr:uncharacterized protein si:ch211-217g15.3 [Nerophis ophidion]
MSVTLLLELWTIISTVAELKGYFLPHILPETNKRSTMFRITLLVCLIFGIAAKPHKSWNKPADKAFQETVMSGKRPLSVEVEPPEDMDETDIDIDPSMKIWEDIVATGNINKVMVAEEDRDDVHHPSDLRNLQHAQDNTDKEEPEQDSDVMYHKAVEELQRYMAPLIGEDKNRVRFPQPLPEESEAPAHVRRQVEPEQYRDDNRAAVVDWPSENNKYNQPEEDLDHLYHH